MNYSVPKQVAIVLFYNSKGEILLQDRRAKSKWGEEYGFFGGAVEPDESPEQAIAREINEELGIKNLEFKLCQEPPVKDWWHVRGNPPRTSTPNN